LRSKRALAVADDADLTPSQFKQAMSHVAGAVHVVTTCDGRLRAGFTATAVTAVSDHPPTLLVCANAGSASTRALIENGVFCVNTLAFDDEPFASVFAGRTELRGDARFRDGSWGTLETGSPVLGSALAAFDCRVISSQIVATHHVVIGQVVALREGRQRRALLYRHRAFQAL
jgi:flavin reductase